MTPSIDRGESDAGGAPAESAVGAATAPPPDEDGGDASARADASDASDTGNTSDAGGVADARDAGLDAARAACAAAADYVPYVIDMGPNENSAKMGPREKGASDEGRPIRATLTALTAPDSFDAFNFATYLPYYVAQAYQEAIATRPGLRGTVRVTFALDGSGKASQVVVKAPGFPATFVDEVRDRATTTHVVCEPLPASARVSATITLAPRRIPMPGRR